MQNVACPFHRYDVSQPVDGPYRYPVGPLSPSSLMSLRTESDKLDMEPPPLVSESDSDSDEELMQWDLMSDTKEWDNDWFGYNDPWSIVGIDGYWHIAPQVTSPVTGEPEPHLGYVQVFAMLEDKDRVRITLCDISHFPIVYSIMARWSLLQWDKIETGLASSYQRLEELKASRDKKGILIASSRSQ